MTDRATQQPDGRAFESLVLPLLDPLYRAARTLTGNAEDAGDLVQTTCAKALERFFQFQPGTNGKAWMMRIMRNTWIDLLRHRQVVGAETPIDEHLVPARPDSPGQDSSLSQMLERFSDAQVIRSLMELPEPQRMALLLSDVEGMGQDEVAEVLEVAVGTIKSRLSRARAALREKLEAHARDLGFLERSSCRT